MIRLSVSLTSTACHFLIICGLSNAFHDILQPLRHNSNRLVSRVNKCPNNRQCTSSAVASSLIWHVEAVTTRWISMPTKRAMRAPLRLLARQPAAMTRLLSIRVDMRRVVFVPKHAATDKSGGALLAGGEIGRRFHAPRRIRGVEAKKQVLKIQHL